MKKKFLQLFVLLATVASMAACTNNPEFEGNSPQSDLKNEYTKVWITKFGLIDSHQDWCTVSAVTANISMPSGVKNVYIYNADPAEGGHLIGRTSRKGSLSIDMPKGAESVYARLTDADDKLVSRGYYPIVNGNVKVNGESFAKKPSLSRADGITYAHTPSYFDAMIICEDLGSLGDVDFNDIVLGLKHESGDAAKLTIVPMAAGATLASEIYFDGVLLTETHEIISPGSPSSQMLNTLTASIGSVTRLTTIEIDLTDAKYKGWTIANNWGDVSIKVVNANTTVAITKPTQGSAPQMICLGGDWFWPRERIDINRAYTGFTDWSCDAGVLTWLGAWDNNLVVKWDVPTENPDDPGDPDENAMWFKAKTSDNKPYKVHLNGSASETEIESDVKYYVTEPLTSCKNMFAVYSTSSAFILNRDGNFVLGYPTVDNKITEIEFSENFDMSAVTSFAHMFDGSQSLTSVNVSDWTAPTGVLTDMTAMFHHCEKLTALDLSGWTVSNVSEYFDVFGYCSSLTSLNLDGWQFKTGANLRRFLGDTSNLTVKCSTQVETALINDSTVGGTNTTYTRP